MLSLFIDFTDKIRFLLVRDSTLLQVEEVSTENFAAMLAVYGSVEITNCTLLADTFYLDEDADEEGVMLYKVSLHGKKYSVWVTKDDYAKFTKILESITAEHKRIFDKGCYYSAMTSRRGIYLDQHPLYDVIYVSDTELSIMYCSKENSAELINQSSILLGEEVVNLTTKVPKKIISKMDNYSEVVKLPNEVLVILAQAMLSNTTQAEPYLVDSAEVYVTVHKEQVQEDTEAEDRTTMRTVKNKRNLEPSKRNLGQDTQSSHKKRSGGLQKLFLVASIIMCISIYAFSVFCRKDIVALESNYAVKQVSLDTNASKMEMYEELKRNDNKIKKYEAIQKILTIESDNVVMNVGFTDDGFIECVVCMPSLDNQDIMRATLNNYATVISEEADGTLQKGDISWFKVKYKLKL